VCEVWVASAAEFAVHQAALTSVLVAEERAHLAGLREPATATLSRALLRLLLARQLGVRPAEVLIDRRCSVCGRPHGRPRLGGAPPPLHVSVSHGGGLLLLALAGQPVVGVDVEPATPVQEVPAELLELTLTPEERGHVPTGPAAARHRSFLRYWTGKEAVLKAVGTGLDLSPQAVRLSPPDGVGPACVTVPGRDAPDLTVRSLDVGAAHVGALATVAGVGLVPVRPLTPADVLDG